MQCDRCTQIFCEPVLLHLLWYDQKYSEAKKKQGPVTSDVRNVVSRPLSETANKNLTERSGYLRSDPVTKTFYNNRGEK